VFIGFSLTTFTVLAVASVFVFRKRPGWQRLRAVDFCFPLVLLSYIVVGVCMIVWGIIFQPAVSTAALGTIGLGAAVYHVTVKRAAAR